MKKVLIIVYYWPPSGGAGVQRWLKFTKYLPEFGWKPIIYTPDNPDFSLKDESLLKEVHPEVEVIKKPIWEPYGLYRRLFSKKDDKELSTGIKDQKSQGGKLANWIRGNLFIPDPKVYWCKPSVKFLTQYLDKNPVDAIISSGTPHSMHLIALDLKRKFNLPWIADFRDPWTELDILKDYQILPSRMKKYRAYEKEVLVSADLALTTSKVWAEDFKRLGARKAECITNGFDETDFDMKVDPYNEWVMSHFGLLNHLRNPEHLWTAIEELLSEREDFAEKFRLHLGGTIDKDLLQKLQQFPLLSRRLKVFPYLSHEEVIKEYLKSRVLLLLLFNSESGKGNIPGKLFEYLASNKPILAFGPEEGDSSDIVTNSKGVFLKYANDNKETIKKSLLGTFRDDMADHSSAKEFSREQLTKKLATLLEELV